jgi:hypothetical protein
MPLGCIDCGFSNASPSPTGASPINGSPRNCSCGERRLHKSQRSCAVVVRGFRDDTPTLTITSAAHSHVPRGNSKPTLFLGAIFSSTAVANPLRLARDRAARAPLGGIFMPKPSLSPTPWASPACVRTAPAIGSPMPSADAFRCRPSPGTRRWRRERVPDSDIRFGIPLHI